MKTSRQPTPVMFLVMRCVAFVCMIGTIILLLQHIWLTGLRRYPTQDLGTFSKAMSGKINAEILVVGSSRAQKHFDPRVISSITKRTTYNLGLDGTAIDLQAGFFHAYLRHNIAPRYLILSLDIGFSLADKRDGNIYHPGQYVAHLNQPELVSALKSRSSEWAIYKMLPFIGIARFTSPLTSGNEQLRYEALRGFLNRPLPECLISGFDPVDKNWTTEFDEYKKQHPNGVTFEIDPENIRIIRAMLTKCQQSRITPILVYSPEYFENQTFTKHRDAIFDVFRQLAKEFAVPFWDYSNSEVSANKENFYNSQHLNVKGAKLFSADVALRLQTMITIIPAKA